MSFNGEMVKQTMIQPYRAMPLSNKKESTADTRSAAAAKSLHSCPTLCDPIDGSPPASAIPGILQARTLEWVAISFSVWKWKVQVKLLSRVRLEWPHGLQPTRLLHPWDFLGKSTGVGCHCRLWLTHMICKHIQRFLLSNKKSVLSGYVLHNSTYIDFL